MTRFKIICPECGATVIAATRISVVLEVCPSCRHHIWDLYDSLMAEVYLPNGERRINLPGQRVEA